MPCLGAFLKIIRLVGRGRTFFGPPGRNLATVYFLVFPSFNSKDPLGRIRYTQWMRLTSDIGLNSSDTALITCTHPRKDICNVSVQILDEAGFLPCWTFACPLWKKWNASEALGLTCLTIGKMFKMSSSVKVGLCRLSKLYSFNRICNA